MRPTGKISSALLGLISLAAIDAHADEPAYTTQVIPQCKVYQLNDGRNVCGWTDLKDVQLASIADAFIVKCRETTKAQAIQVEALGVQLSGTTEALHIEQKTTTVLIARNKELTYDLIAMNKRFETERARPRWGNPIAWTTAAVLGAMLVAYVTADAIH